MSSIRNPDYQDVYEDLVYEKIVGEAIQLCRVLSWDWWEAHLAAGADLSDPSTGPLFFQMALDWAKKRPRSRRCFRCFRVPPKPLGKAARFGDGVARYGRSQRYDHLVHADR